VERIVEWAYWNALPEEKQNTHEICNAGIYSVKKKDLLRYLPVLASRPHQVIKTIDGKEVPVEEFFITDLVEFMSADGLSVGYILAEDEQEVMGVDDLPSLLRARELYRGG
jgi:bifunctional UDP-N-acetylglucosamine pyrophosphorylase/glucosamine-1-phosphate N-acetyltransferase